jgi:tetratricopeptide (TPR) repeat protein
MVTGQNSLSDEFFEKGLNASKNKNYKEALIFFDKIIQLDSMNMDAYNLRGVAKYETGDYIGAYNDYTTALHYSSPINNFYIIYSNRSQTLNALKRYDETIDDCNMALQQKPDDKVSLLNRGIAYDKLKKYDLAADDFNKAINIDSTYSRVHASLGLTLYHQTKYDSALVSLNKAIKYEPSYAMAYHWKGLVQGIQNNKKEAIECFTMALSINPNFIESRVMKGVLYAQSGIFNKACDEFKKALLLTNEKDKIDLINNYRKEAHCE